MLLRKELITDGASKIIARKKVNNKNFLNEEASKLFSELKEKGFVYASSFNSNYWTMYCTVEDNIVPFSFSYKSPLNKEINEVFKRYILIRRLSGFAVGSIKSEFQRIKKILEKSRFFRDEISLEKHLYNVSELEVIQLGRCIIRFINFYDVPNKTSLIKMVKNFPVIKNKNRELPSFEDVLIYDEIVNSFFNNAKVEDQIPYLSVLLWWKVTNVIPMRPNEFYKLKQDCIEVENGAYWFKFERSKIVFENQNPTNSNRTKVQIDKDTYDLINNVREKIVENMTTESIYLFNSNYYEKCINKQNDVFYGMRLNQYRFMRILNKFNRNIVMKRYGETPLTKIRPGDTRHFAIINMFLQGFNALSIARMAGHTDLNSQVNYYTHARHFAKSYVYHLAQSRFEHKINTIMKDGILGWRRAIVNKNIAGDCSENAKQKRIKYGFCQDNSDEFPMNCTEDCRVCSYYFFDPTLDEYNTATRWLEEYTESLTNRIDVVLNFMRDVNLNYDKDREIFINEELSQNSRQLGLLLDYKSIVDSKILGVKLYE